MLSALFAAICFILILTLLVGIHEAGHAIVARLCGARVSEFFIGMPFGPEVARTSPRSGIRYGATLALLGGYTRIAGMTLFDDKRGALVLALVNARGRVNVDEVAEVLDCSPNEAIEVLASLQDWGSIEEDWPQGMPHGRNEYPPAYRTVARDSRGLTLRDRGHDFSQPGSTQAGEPFRPTVSSDAFFAQERTRTYQGLSVPKRLAVLVAGVACNLLAAFVVFVIYYMLHGVPTIASLDVAAVTEGSAAAAAGMVAGDRVYSIDGVPVTDYNQLGDQLENVRGTGAFELVYQHDGELHSASVTLGDDEMLGVQYGVAMSTLSFADAASYALSYIGAYAQAVASLLNPAEAQEVLENSSGLVGIAVLTQDAVASSIWETLALLGVLSLSLGWMNLLPIPPLDGGKIVIELIQAVLRRPLSARLQGALNLVGIALFCTLFIYMVAQDVARLMGM